MMRVLIVEDYAPVRNSVSQGLRENGFAVDVAEDGEVGLWFATSNQYDVIVLDVMLPKVDGLAVLKNLHAAHNTARVLLLTARDALEDRVAGLNSGADDYLVKPFSFDELLARVRALVRRQYPPVGTVLSIADLEIDTVQRLARRGEQPIELTGREFALLEFLARRAGQVVSRSEIWEHVYCFHSSATSNVVDVYIGYLRRKIERPGESPLIVTRRGHGYMLGEPS